MMTRLVRAGLLHLGGWSGDPTLDRGTDEFSGKNSDESLVGQGDFQGINLERI
jgi:hypothetical protein